MHNLRARCVNVPQATISLAPFLQIETDGGGCGAFQV